MSVKLLIIERSDEDLFYFANNILRTRISTKIDRIGFVIGKMRCFVVENLSALFFSIASFK